MKRIALALALSGCCFTPTPEATAPVVAPPASVAAPIGPSGPAAPGCPDLTTTIVGTWTHEGLVEEYRAGGVYVINGVAGTYAFATPGHVVLDVPSSGLHGEYDIGIADPATLIAIDATHVALVYTRTTPAPSVPPSCYDLSTSFARTWLPRGGGPPETYAADGTFTVVGTGRWSFTAPGRLLLVGSEGVTTDYIVAMPSASTMLAVRAAQGLAYDAAP